MSYISYTVTFASTTTSSQLNVTQYCNATTCGSGNSLPHRAAGCSASYPDKIGVPYGIAGLCNRIAGSTGACAFPDPPAPVHANINLTGTGLRLLQNTSMNFIYPDDETRGIEFNATSFLNTFGADIVADAIVSSTGESISLTVPNVLQPFDAALGSCRWITTENWLVDAFTGDAASITARAEAIRTGSGTICVCKDTGSSGNADCAIPNCTYNGSSYQLHYLTASTATACNVTEEYQVMPP